jgi:hypothetical protein
MRNMQLQNELGALKTPHHLLETCVVMAGGWTFMLLVSSLTKSANCERFLNTRNVARL